MRRLALVALVLGSFGSVACGSAAEPLPALGADGGPAASSELPGQAPGADGGRGDGRPAEPPAPPAKAEEVTEQYGVFVAKDGTAENPGTRKSPLASIAEGIAKAKADKKGRVYVCEGTYLESLELEAGVSIVGGLDCSGPTWKLTDKRSTLDAPSSPAIRAVGITTATRVDGLDVKAPNATSPSGSSIGLFAVDSNALTFAKGSITAGDGMKGDDGVEGEPLVLSVETAAVAGGGNVVLPNLPGAPLAGGAGATAVCKTPDGLPSMRTAGATGGSSGVYSAFFGAWNVAMVGVDAFVYPAHPGDPGARPGSGNAGTAGASSAGGTLGEEGYLPGDGTAGSNGDVGQGGRGAKGQAPTIGVAANQHAYGHAGGGGGAGGCPGLAGTAGKGGGASIAAALVRSPVRFDGMALTAGAGGAGGRGTFGSNPTGGSSGADDALPWVMSPERTSAGGLGGAAGISGHGAGGPSIAIAHEGLAAIVAQSTSKPGVAGPGVAAVSQGARTIPASPAGVAEAVRAY